MTGSGFFEGESPALGKAFEGRDPDQGHPEDEDGMGPTGDPGFDWRNRPNLI